MSTLNYADEKHVEEKAVPAYVTEPEGDGSSSINTLTALIAEGENFF